MNFMCCMIQHMPRRVLAVLALGSSDFPSHLPEWSQFDSIAMSNERATLGNTTL